MAITRGVRQFGDEQVLASADQQRALALVLDRGRVLVLDDGVHFTLPGGPVEDTETETALARLVQAETGHEVTEATLFQRAVLHPADEGGVRLHCDYYRVDLGERSERPLPHDSVARWAPQEAALDLLGDEASRWALSVALCADAIVTGLRSAPSSLVPDDGDRRRR